MEKNLDNMREMADAKVQERLDRLKAMIKKAEDAGDSAIAAGLVMITHDLQVILDAARAIDLAEMRLFLVMAVAIISTLDKDSLKSVKRACAEATRKIMIDTLESALKKVEKKKAVVKEELDIEGIKVPISKLN